MKQLSSLMKAFEKRNNTSIYIKCCSDNSGTVYEFWEDDEIYEYESEEDLYEFLENASFELDENGLCNKPMKRIDQ